MHNPLLTLPPLDALRGFVAAARRMSITAAAEDLCLTQSAVSRQIQQLEERLGTPLFVRARRSIVLTDAGAQLFELASPWMDQLAELSDNLRHDTKLRPVTITASIGVAALWILPRLGAFQAEHPHIDIRVAASNRLTDLKRDGVDLAIRYCPAALAPEGSLHLFDEEIVPVASKAVARHAFSDPGALLEHVLLDLDERSRPWLHWAQWLKAYGIRAKPKGYLHFNQYDQVIQAAIEGNGVALGRLALVLPMLKDGRLVADMPQRRRADDYGYWLIQATEHPRREVALFRDWVRAQVERTSKELAQAVRQPARAQRSSA
ncbi:LysR substrate-binding domain-containing protein [Massilia endophytica]|uniref:LysR substrate-binding domain-containing protein n=1 Tax=Massilia endophytica TaxID=2899220 RepID=UPI001E3B657E|nr:LysR substrate-binding domain-containing protein [Massilia endophytica]UGQ46423.1 LysR substrate-binding domain-containing protein [Massilia endophytica]